MPQLLAYQLETGSVSVILEGDIREALLSPDGAWLVVHWSCALGEPPGHWVMPSRFTQQMRQLEIGTNTTGFAWRSLRPLAMLDTLRLGNLTMPLDGFGVPEAVALDRAGRRLALPASSLRWSLEDTSIAVIDPGSGRITPLRQGTTRMTVTAGGWRSATGALTVTPPKTRTVLADSTWDDLDPSPTAAGRWRLYGDPLPRRGTPPGVLPCRTTATGSTPRPVLAGTLSSARRPGHRGARIRAAFPADLADTMRAAGIRALRGSGRLEPPLWRNSADPLAERSLLGGLPGQGKPARPDWPACRSKLG